LKLEAWEEEHRKEMKLKEKDMEQRNSRGIVVERVLGIATVRIPSHVHWIFEERWYNLKEKKS